MKVLLDTCVWGGAKSVLEAQGHEVIWSGDWPQDPGDSEILAQAHQENRVLVTIDKDFGELAIVYGQPHSGIMRLVGLSARQQGAVCVQVLALHGHELQAGAIITADSKRIRVRLVDS